MDVIERKLGDIDGGRVLDVATQEGGFVQILMQNLKDYAEIIAERLVWVEYWYDAARRINIRSQLKSEKNEKMVSFYHINDCSFCSGKFFTFDRSGE